MNDRLKVMPHALLCQCRRPLDGHGHTGADVLLLRKRAGVRPSRLAVEMGISRQRVNTVERFPDRPISDDWWFRVIEAIRLIAPGGGKG